MNKPEYIIVHHSATKDGAVRDWDAIRRFHTSFRYQGEIVSPQEASALRSQGCVVESPWNDIGYQAGIERINGVLTSLVGRPIADAGAHCKEANMNSRSIGVCVVGNFDLVPPDLETVFFLRDLCFAYMVNYRIAAQNILGHRDAGLMAGFDWRKGEFKTCPGKLFPLSELRNMVAGKVDTTWQPTTVGGGGR